MRPYIALVKREFLEHRGAFLIAPAVITLLVIFVFASAIVLGRSDIQAEFTIMDSKATLFTAFYAVSIVLWTIYLMIALFFYYADSFSADRKNNGLLFWKSMPQSDLKILGSKVLAGGTIFPMAIGAWILIAGVMAYLFSIWIAGFVPGVNTADPLSFLNSYFQMSISAAIFIFLSLLWYAPFFAWVAMLSTVFKRWSIPLAFVVPGLLILAERIFRIGEENFQSHIGNFIAYRIENMFANEALLEDIATQESFNGASFVFAMLNQLNWPHLFLGLVITAGFVYAASEYRRRLIEA
ncbi:ABC-2 type transport system permease protein [Maritalea mobilis]|uniref:ABC-2 type transport system permease protein n=1 Tax=Maritalea mobilis TaxID=483324 RepID=A0A4R6VV60_9HYPH|nr:hypothetical protein [Maritalea mobilis]TDQ66636.1 ABC-2 type transport system permease protein [Maritalea mobilis]